MKMQKQGNWNCFKRWFFNSFVKNKNTGVNFNIFQF